MKTLLLLRHAEAEEFAPGRPDRDRALTARGVRQAKAVGTVLADLALRVDHALCSPATRTRQTLDALGLNCSAEFPSAMYNAGSDTILDLVHEFPDDLVTCLVVGHAPAVPGLVHQLADEGSDPSSLAIIEHRFPPATLAVLNFAEQWAELDRAELVSAKLQT